MNRLESEKSIRTVEGDLPAAGLKPGTGTAPGRDRAAGQRLSENPGKAASRGVEILQADWSQYDWLHHGFSTRSGGVSDIYGEGSLNLSWTKDDLPEHVELNRSRFLSKLLPGQELSRRLVTIGQFHSGMIHVLSPEDLAVSENGRPLLRGDALITDVPGVILGIQTADCVPVLVADVRNKAVAAFHAGWRGTLARIVQHGIGTMRLQYGSEPRDLIAAIGPSIGRCCYAVGDDLRSDFESQFAYARELFSDVYDPDSVKDPDPVEGRDPLLFLTAHAHGHSNVKPQIHLDLVEANRRQLLDAGLDPVNISVAAECTACARDAAGERRYFSHRAESGFTGRLLSVIGIAE